ncbi:hypothetical protein CLOP_g2476 [Closterium sp. NIES-67]|nr:hypothetical protein CLOP_g2476 [Closterium sp. NIES-67]
MLNEMVVFSEDEPFLFDNMDERLSAAALSETPDWLRDGESAHSVTSSTAPTTGVAESHTVAQSSQAPLQAIAAVLGEGAASEIPSEPPANRHLRGSGILFSSQSH